MTLVSFLIFTTIACTIGLILFLFYKKNKDIKLKHDLEMISLKKAISIHKNQVNNRENGMNNYNFIKYNLNDSLVVQSEIKLI